MCEDEMRQKADVQRTSLVLKDRISQTAGLQRFTVRKLDDFSQLLSVGKRQSGDFSFSTDVKRRNL